MVDEIKKDKDGTEIVNLSDKITVYATDKAPYHEVGEEMVVHPKMAEHFIAKGFASKTKPKTAKD